MVGRVTSCKRDKGYCFIREHDTGNSYFCHFSKTDDVAKGVYYPCWNPLNENNMHNKIIHSHQNEYHTPNFCNFYTLSQ